MELRGHLDLLLLATLERLGAAHGYAVVTAVRDASHGALDLAEGTVYPALHRLERGGALAASSEPGTTGPRRVYRLTSAGRLMLGARRADWRAFVRAVDHVIGDG